MTTSIEKIFFIYILNNKKYFEIVKPYFFKNSEINFVYNIVRQYMLSNSDVKIPSPKQILEMVSIDDKEGIITKDILKSILSVKLDEYDEKNFIEPKFNTWILANRVKSGTVDIIEETRNMESISDFQKAIESAEKIKNIVSEMSSTNFIDDDSLGSDFDDADMHIQDSSKFKVKSGFETLDHMLGGGWDIQTLNCIMSETNNGKCSIFPTKLYIREITNYKVFLIKIGTLFTNISKGRNSI